MGPCVADFFSVADPDLGGSVASFRIWLILKLFKLNIDKFWSPLLYDPLLLVTFSIVSDPRHFCTVPDPRIDSVPCSYGSGSGSCSFRQ
jgi:hypothetical protein